MRKKEQNDAFWQIMKREGGGKMSLLKDTPIENSRKHCKATHKESILLTNGTNYLVLMIYVGTPLCLVSLFDI